MRTNSTRTLYVLFLSATVTLLSTTSQLLAVTTIDQYILYGEHGVQIGGGSTVNGLVGARFPDAANHGIFLNGGAITIGDARSATNVNLANNAHITGTVYIPSLSLLSMGAGSSVGATNIGNPDLPVFPSATAFVAGTSNIVNLTTTLTAGSYSNLTLGNGDTLSLTGGVYYLNTLTLSGNATVNLDTTGGPIHVYMTGDANLDGRDANIIGSPNDIFWEVHGDWTAGGGTTGWGGTLFVPFGTAHIGSGSGTTDFTGHIWADLVDIQHNVTVTVPEPTTLVLTAISFAGLAVLVRKTTRRRL